MEAEGSTLLTVVRGEARRVHASATSLALGVTFLLISVPLFVAGIAMLAAGLMWWLETQVSRPLAVSLTGLLILASGAACLTTFKLLTAKPQP
jgi:uncharacterized membrane protein YqgA involved in biofilm formation